MTFALSYDAAELRSPQRLPDRQPHAGGWRYTAFPGEDQVEVTDPESGALAVTVSGIIEFDYPRLVIEPEYFNRLGYYRKDLREQARQHYQNSVRGRSVR